MPIRTMSPPIHSKILLTIQSSEPYRPSVNEEVLREEIRVSRLKIAKILKIRQEYRQVKETIGR